MNKRHTVLHSELIQNRGESRVFQMNIPGESVKIVGFRISTSLTGDAMSVSRHYIGGTNVLNPDDLVEADVLAVDEQIEMRNKVITIAVETNAGNALLYARKSNIEGIPSFYINGEPLEMLPPATISITDPETSAVDNYDVYLSVDTDVEGTLYVKG